MKHAVYIPFLFCLVLPFLSDGQSVNDLSQLFYQLPLDSSRAVIIQHITRDSAFTKVDKKNQSSFSQLYGDTYTGEINKVNLPADIQTDYVTTIEIAWGSGKYTISKKEYGASISIIKIEYFFSDIQVADKYFNYVWDKIKSSSINTFEITVGNKNDNIFYSGKQVQFPDPEKRYPSRFNLLKRELTGKGQYILLEYRREGN